MKNDSALGRVIFLWSAVMLRVIRSLFQRRAEVARPNSSVYKEPNAEAAKGYEFQYAKAKFAFVKAIRTYYSYDPAQNHAEEQVL